MSVSARIAGLAVGVIALGGGLAACNDDDGEAAELRAELAEVTAERDELQGYLGAVEERHDKSVETVAGAEIEVIHRWFDPDGSMSGSLWVWRGTNSNGNPFELIGVNVTTHDDEGRIADSWVVYPYPDEYVAEGFTGEGTEVSGMWGD